jgi:hypothetical protein
LPGEQLADEIAAAEYADLVKHGFRMSSSVRAACTAAEKVDEPAGGDRANRRLATPAGGSLTSEFTSAGQKDSQGIAPDEQLHSAGPTSLANALV